MKGFVSTNAVTPQTSKFGIETRRGLAFVIPQTLGAARWFAARDRQPVADPRMNPIMRVARRHLERVRRRALLL